MLAISGRLFRAEHSWGLTFPRLTGANRDAAKYSLLRMVAQRFASGATASWAAQILARTIRLARTARTRDQFRQATENLGAV